MSLPRARRIQLERSLTERLTPEDHVAASGFLHFCDEWDGMLIERDWVEFDYCGCRFAYPDFDPFAGRRAPRLSSPPPSNPPLA